MVHRVAGPVRDYEVDTQQGLLTIDEPDSRSLPVDHTAAGTTALDQDWARHKAAEAPALHTASIDTQDGILLLLKTPNVEDK
jgi:hypothetical protein